MPWSRGPTSGRSSGAALWTPVQGVYRAWELGSTVPAVREPCRRGAGGPHFAPGGSSRPMSSRQQNVTAAQWSVNGGALGAPDLTAPGANVFGANVFTVDEQRSRLPKHVFKKLQATLEAGQPLESSLADAVAQARREGATENGRRHY